MLFVVSENQKQIEGVEVEDFIKLDIKESLIQGWVRTHPELLGEDLLIVSTELNPFEGAKDRPDLIAIDRNGDLVVIELKRDRLAGFADLQSVRYAARISTITVDDLAPYYADYCRKFAAEDVTEEDFRDRIDEFVFGSFEEFSNRPRIILCSQDFAQEITTTVLWLREFGLDISCVKIAPHEVDNKIVIVSEKIIPLPEADAYLTGIKKKEEQRQEAKQAIPTEEEICAMADEEGIGEPFRRILDFAKQNGLNLQINKRSIKYTSPANRKNALFTVWLKSGRPENEYLKLYTGNFSEFYPIDFEKAESIVGPEGWRDAYKNMDEFMWSMNRLFEAINNN